MYDDIIQNIVRRREFGMFKKYQILQSNEVMYGFLHEKIAILRQLAKDIFVSSNLRESKTTLHGKNFSSNTYFANVNRNY